jgi:alanine racemase
MFLMITFGGRAMLSTWVPGDSALEIDLAAVEENFRIVSAMIGPRVLLGAVVKSDAYGLGMVPIADSLHALGCNLFFVGNIEEALDLRAQIAKADIAVLCDNFSHFHEIYRRERLTPVLNSTEDVKTLARLTHRQPFILNVETGFSRLGISLSDIRDLHLAGFFTAHRPLALMSHLACSECAADETNILQRHRFQAACTLVKPQLASLAASAGLWLGESYRFGMVRVGSALYGLNNAGVQPSPLRPVVRLNARVLDIRNVPPREAVGYAASYRTTRPSRLAVLGIGYKNGIPWSCANRISVRFGNYRAPIVGRISMEFVTAEITDVPEHLCHPGALASILDDDFGPEQLAKAAGVVPQEILVRLGGGCTRRYVHPAASPKAPRASGDHAAHPAPLVSSN